MSSEHLDHRSANLSFSFAPDSPISPHIQHILRKLIGNEELPVQIKGTWLLGHLRYLPVRRLFKNPQPMLSCFRTNVPLSRRLWRVEIQEYLIAAIQNIEVLLRYGGQPKKSLLVEVNQVKGVIKGVIQPISGMIKDFMLIETNGIMPLAFARVQFRET